MFTLVTILKKFTKLYKALRPAVNVLKYKFQETKF